MREGSISLIRLCLSIDFYLFFQTEKIMLSPYRSIGLFSSSIPHKIKYDSRTNSKVPFIVVPIGNVFLSYYADKLRLLCISDPTTNNQDISSIATDKNFIYASAGDRIYKYVTNRRIISEFKSPSNSENSEIFLKDTLLPFGEFLIAATSNHDILVFDSLTEKLHLKIPKINENFKISCIAHPATYLNKILVGSSNSSDLRLVNVKSGKEIYCFKSIRKNEDQNQNVSITSLLQTTAKSVVSVGFSNGQIDFLNIDSDEIILSLTHNYPITCQSFRTDDVEQFCVGLADGTFSVWDLQNQRLVGNKKAHNNEIAGLTFLNQQGLMVTNSVDNSICLFQFEVNTKETLTMPMLYNSRKGHSKPVKFCQFQNTGNLNSGSNLNSSFFLTAGKDCNLSSWSLDRPGNCLNLGTAKSTNSKNFKRAKKSNNQTDLENFQLEEFSILKVNTIRKNDWACIVGAHKNFLSFWNLEFKRQENFIKFDKESLITALEISGCGNFCYVGFESGNVKILNLQSYLERGSFSTGTTSGSANAVNFIGAPLFLDTIITGSGSQIKFWDWNIRKGTIKHKETFNLPNSLQVDQAGGTLLPHLSNGGSSGSADPNILLCLSDFSIILLSKNSNQKWNISRKLFSTSPIISFCLLQPDCNLLIASCSDSTIQTWDLMSGLKIDIFKLPTRAIATSISCAEDGRFVATSHSGEKGICLWVNLAGIGGYDGAGGAISQKKEEEILKFSKAVKLPGLLIDENEVNIEGDSDSEEDENSSSGSESEDDDEDQTLEIKEKFANSKQLCKNLLTLSTTPASKWASLPRLDALKNKNKIIDPSKKPSKIPFFLETKKGLTDKYSNLEFDLEMTEETNLDQTNANSIQKGLRSKILDRKGASLSGVSAVGETRLGRVLMNQDEKDEKSLFDFFEKLTPSQIDSELRSLIVYDDIKENEGDDDDDNNSATKNLITTKNITLLTNFLTFIKQKLISKTDYELANSYLAIFLNIHEDYILNQKVAPSSSPNHLDKMKHTLNEILNVLDEECDQLSFKFDQSLAVMGWLKHSVV